MRPLSVALVTLANDRHGLEVRKELEAVRDVACHFVACDRITGSGLLSWWSEAACTLPTREGGAVDARELDAVWWRRSGSPQAAESSRSKLDADVAAADALLGALETRFDGAWVSGPEATRHAENKLVQLAAAEAAGFRVPRTLVSQDPAAIREFADGLAGATVVKPLRASRHREVLAGFATPALLASDESLRLSHAIYQEHIPGRQNVRAACFGDEVHAVLIESDMLDWKASLEGGVSEFELSEEVAGRLAAVLERLRLRMGLVDLKLTEDGETVWLEVNPQGDFRFMELLAGVELTSRLAAFLVREAARARR